MNACRSDLFDSLAIRHDNQLRLGLQLCHFMCPFDAFWQAALTFIRVTPGVGVAIISHAHRVAVLITLAAADLEHAKIIIGKESDLSRLIEALASTLSTTLLPSIVAPGVQLALLRDACSIVHTSDDLFNRPLDLGYEGRHICLIIMSTQV